MKFNLIFTITLVISLANVFGQKNDNYNSFIKQANNFYKSKNYKSSLNSFEKAFKIYDEDASDLYNAACTASLSLNLEKAKLYLTYSINNGWNNLEHLYKDSDLYNLHCLDEWKSFLKKVEVNQKKTLSKEHLSDKINGFIKKNKYDAIYKLANNDFKSNVRLNDLRTTINSIHQLLKENNIKSLQSIQTNTKSSTNWVNGVINKSFNSNYNLVPKYLNGNISSLFIKPLGYNIKIILLKQNGKWLLSHLKLKNKYADLNYEMGNKINTFFKEPGSLLFSYTLKNNNQKSHNTGIIKNIEINNVIINEFKNLKHIKMSELNAKAVYNNLSKIYSLTFHSNKKSKSTVRFNPFIKKLDKELINTFEFIFFDNNSNLVLISNGYKYGFYQINSVKKLKEIVVNKITEIAK